MNKVEPGGGRAGFPVGQGVRAGHGQEEPVHGQVLQAAGRLRRPRTARGVVDFATGALPNHVVPVTDKSFSKFKSENSTVPKAVLFTKTETTSLLKSLSVLLKDRMIIGEARDVATKAAADFGVNEFPSLLVLPAGSGVEGEVAFEGEMKPASLTAFLETHAFQLAPLVRRGEPPPLLLLLLPQREPMAIGGDAEQRGLAGGGREERVAAGL